MSYSFSIRASSKGEAKAKVSEQMVQVVQSQPSHEADSYAAITAANSFIELLNEPKEGEEIRVHMNGSLGWIGVNPESFTHANINIQAGVHPVI